VLTNDNESKWNVGKWLICLEIKGNTIPLLRKGLVKIFENTDELNWLSCHDNQVK
jgi:hypothetical protein